MAPLVKLPVMFALLLLAPLANAQNNLGALLDAGARRLSADEFKQELVQHAIVGPTPAGVIIEVIYTVNGIVEGTATDPTRPQITVAKIRVDGEWKLDESARICTSMKFGYEGGSRIGGGAGYLPPRCQYWFMLGDKYFISDSDSDRSAKVFSRTVKQ